MRRLLIVDDDLSVLEIFKDTLEPYSENLEVLTASNVDEAIRIISHKKVDMVLTDLKMPVMDGFDFLSYVNRFFPKTPLFVMSGYDNPEYIMKLKEISPIMFLKKPFKINKFINYLRARFKLPVNKSLQNKVWGLSLSSFMEVIRLEEKTCTIKAEFKSETGYLYFNKGDLVAAEAGPFKNVDAAVYMLNWGKPFLEIQIHKVQKKTREMDVPFEKLMIQAEQVKSQVKRIKEQKEDAEKLNFNNAVNAA